MVVDVLLKLLSCAKFSPVGYYPVKTLLFCYKYNGATGEYEVDYLMVVTLLMGSVFLSVMIFLIIYLFRGSEKKDKRH